MADLTAKQQRVKSIFDSERFERMVETIFSHLMIQNLKEHQYDETSALNTGQETMNYALNSAYIFTANYQNSRDKHLVERMKENE